MRKEIAAVGFVSMMMLAGCQTTGTGIPDGQPNLAEKTRVTVEWGNGARYYCDSHVSPRIVATGAPVDGVAKVKAWMIDLDYTSYPHQGNIFAADDVLKPDGGLDIPQDAIATAPGGSYQAPCSKAGPHRYRFTLYFLDAAGSAIGVKQAEPSPLIP